MDHHFRASLHPLDRLAHRIWPRPRARPRRLPNMANGLSPIFEALSVGVLVTHVWFCVLIPRFPYLRNFKKTDEKGALSLDGLHVIGGLLAVFADEFLNTYQYIFMWNQHSVNVGVWAKFLPFHNPEAKSRYAESLLWGPPMYIYFCAGFGILGCGMANRIRKHLPWATNATVLSIVWIIECILDFIIENAAIRLTHGYGYAKTYGPLTLFKNKTHQFPIYESVSSGRLGVCSRRYVSRLWRRAYRLLNAAMRIGTRDCRVPSVHWQL